VKCNVHFYFAGAIKLVPQRLVGFTEINPLIATLKPQNNGPSCSNAVIGTLAIDGWAVTFGTAGRGLSLPRPFLAVPNVTGHPLTASVPTSYYSMWHYNCLWILKD